MHIYAFGSICRGQVDFGSDIDLLAIVDGVDSRFDPNQYSIYSYNRINEIWTEGNPFAWHLSLEAKLLFSSNNSNLFQKLGTPTKYKNGLNDCKKFYKIFNQARESFCISPASAIFDLSSIFLAIRNFATCYSLACMQTAIFSRHSALMLNDKSLPISKQAYDIYMRSRLLCTRGLGVFIGEDDMKLAASFFDPIEEWMVVLLNEKGLSE